MFKKNKDTKEKIEVKESIWESPLEHYDNKEKNDEIIENDKSDEMEEFKQDKEEESLEQVDQVFPRIDPEKYYRFRFLLSQHELARSKLEYKRLRGVLLQKNIEIAQLQRQLFNMIEFRQAENEFKARGHEYNLFVVELEKELGFSLENKTIDDVTFEIKDAPKEQDSIKKE